MDGRFLFLGTGSSVGVPSIGCSCVVCRSKDPKNNRLRCSALLQIGNKKILIDAGPDHRTQALAHGITSLDGVVITHAHYDHIAGIGDLKAYSYRQGKLACVASEDTWQQIKKTFFYLFSSDAFFSCTALQEPFESRVFAGVPIRFLRFFQAGMQVTGIKIGNLAYVSDIKSYEDQLTEELQDIHNLVISCVRNGHSEMHFSVSEAVLFAEKVKAQRVYLTHIGHELDHETLQKQLPSSVIVAYDGLTFSFQAGE